MKVCVCFLLENVECTVELKEFPIKKDCILLKKLEGIDKRDQMLCNTNDSTCPSWLLIKRGHLQFAAGFG